MFGNQTEAESRDAGKQTAPTYCMSCLTRLIIREYLAGIKCLRCVRLCTQHNKAFSHFQPETGILKQRT